MADAAFALAGKRVYVAGHRGMVGSALVRRLSTEACEIVTVDRRTVDLRNQAAVDLWFKNERPDVVFLAAAKVGGIHANNMYRADFIFENLIIACNVIHAAHIHGTSKLMFLGSTCIYPRLASQPMSEDAMLTGPLEPTNEPYAIAKIAGIKLAELFRRQYGDDFISVMPTNLYGPGDNYDLENGHVVAALIRRFHEAARIKAPSVTVWGTGNPRREFLHVDDLADACVFIMKHYSDVGLLNIGTGKDQSIAEFASIVAEVVGFKGEITFDPSRPDGTPRKLVDVSRLNQLGWRPSLKLREGLQRTYRSFLMETGG